MIKNDFLLELRRELEGLPEEEINKAIDYYAEMIEDAVEDGADEAEVIERLGKIEDISREIIDKTPIRKLVKEKFRRIKQEGHEHKEKSKDGAEQKSIPIFTIILLIVGSPLWVPLIAAFFAVLASLYLALWAVIAAVVICAIAFAVCAPACLVMAVVFLFITPLKALFSLGCALFFAGAAILVGALSIFCVKLTVNLTVFVMRQIKNIFIRKRSGRNE